MKCPGQLFSRVLLGQSQLRRKPPQLKCAAVQFGITPAEGVFGLLSCTDVRNEGNRMSTICSRDVIQTDFDWKRGTVLALPCYIYPGAHYIRLRRTKVRRTGYATPVRRCGR